METTVQTVPVEIKTVKVGKRQMTKAMLEQIPMTSLFGAKAHSEDNKWAIEFPGTEFWGYVQTRRIYTKKEKDLNEVDPHTLWDDLRVLCVVKGELSKCLPSRIIESANFAAKLPKSHDVGYDVWHEIRRELGQLYIAV